MKMKVYQQSYIKNTILYVVIFILAGLNYDNPDFFMYEGQFNNPNQNYNFERIYTTVMAFLHDRGWTYAAFLALQVCLCLLMLHWLMRRLQVEEHVVLLWLLISPLALFIVQSRAFFAYCILYIAIYYMLDDWKGEIIAVILILIASQFHNSLYLYFIFFVAKRFRTSLLAIGAVVFNILTNILLGDYKLLKSIFLRLDGIIPLYKTSYYFLSSERRPSMNGLLATYMHYFIWLAVVVVICYAYYCSVEHEKCESFYRFVNRNDCMPCKFLRMYISIAVVLPFMQIDTIFERYYFYMAPMIYIIAAWVICNHCNLVQRRNVILVTSLGSIFGLCYILVVNGAFYRVIVPIFKCNYLLQYLF